MITDGKHFWKRFGSGRRRESFVQRCVMLADKAVGIKTGLRPRFIDSVHRVIGIEWRSPWTR
jgi:hypothetical protein